jgi:exodeoxyribonuclease VII large subunit
LFSETHKLPIPKYPKAIGVITSPTGAAIRDIINVVNNRFPLTEIIVYPALVQGPMAKDSIVKMIEKANNDKLVDVLIIGRGGGSIEDLWSFNEEIVARAVYNSHIPIISAVGHETDFTIIDFVSDLRASTPSHAAELAVRNKRDVLEDIIDYSKRLRLALVNRYKQEKKRYLNIVETNIFKNPLRLTQSKEIAYANLTERLFQSRPDRLIALQKEKVNNLLKTIDSAYKYKVNRTNSNYLNLLEKLELVNPLNIMKKGFTIIKQDELIKKSINDIDELKEVSIIMHDGEIDCKILKMKGRENE